MKLLFQSSPRIVKLLLINILFLSPVQATASDAILIGITEYETSPLDTPLNDVALISNKLKSLGWNVTILTNPTARGLKSDVERFAKTLKSDNSNATLLYFSGHGFQYSGENYMVPSDIDDYASLTENSLSISEINYFFRNIKTPKILIIDACRSASLGANTLAVSTGLNSQSAPPNTLIAYATGPGQFALDGRRGGTSPYATAFVNSLNSFTNVVDVFRETRSLTMGYTDGEQIPWESSSLLQNVMFTQGTAIEPPKPGPSEILSTYQSASISAETILNIDQKENSINSYSEAVDYLIETTRISARSSFVHYFWPTWDLASNPENHRMDIIEELKRQKHKVNYHSIVWSLQEGVINPPCRDDGKANHNCSDTTTMFIFKPNLEAAFKLAKYANDENIASSLLAKHYQEGWNVPKNLVKAYDLYMRDKDLGGEYYWADANSMIQNEFINLGHDIAMDGDFGKASCAALQKYIGQTTCLNPISRLQVEKFAKQVMPQF